MEIIKHSFLSDLFDRSIGRGFYDLLKYYAKIIIPIGTCILFISIGLSLICHFSLVSKLVNSVTGLSLLFIIYILAIIISLDKEVEIKNYHTKEYKLTIVRGAVLLVMGVCAIYFTNNYRNHYAFECSTYLVDHNAKVYHIDWKSKCEAAEQASNLEKAKGYQIDDSYTICNVCEETVENIKYDSF